MIFPQNQNVIHFNYFIIPKFKFEVSSFEKEYGSNKNKTGYGYYSSSQNESKGYGYGYGNERNTPGKYGYQSGMFQI